METHETRGGARRAVASAAAALPLALALGCGGSQAGPDAERPDSDDVWEEAHARGGGIRESAAPEVEGQEDDGMQVEGVRGRLSTYQIQMGVRPHRRELSRCYADGAEHEYIGGEIVFGFQVATDGTVNDPRIESSALGAWAVESCLLEIVARMTFDSPDGGAAKVTLPLDFDARKPVATWGEERAAGELAAPPTLPPAEDEAEARRRRERARKARRRRARARRAGEDVEEPAATKREDLDRCAEEAEAAPPEDLRITVYIDRRGRVTSAGFSAGGMIDEAWAECATERITAWRMSAPETPGVSVAKLALPFSPES